MHYRRFGDTDLEVSVICFGPMRFSAKQPGSDELSSAGMRALEHAIDRGVNFIHSSYEYGTRWALGRVLKDHPKRSEMRHIIKVPVPESGDEGVFDPEKFRLRVEEALRDLHTDRIDVIQHLHRANPNTDDLRLPQIPAVVEPLAEIFERLLREGKVGYLTTFPYSPGYAGAALATGAFTGMVAYYNPIEMEMAQYFDTMASRGQGFFCIRPYLAGLLTNQRCDRSRLSEQDRFVEERWLPAYERLDLVETAFAQPVESWTRFAIQYGLIHPLVSSLIVGLNSAAQVDQVVDAAAAPGGLELDLWEKAAAVWRERGSIANV